MSENNTTPAEPDTPTGPGRHRGPAEERDATAAAGGPRGRHRRTERPAEQESRAA